MHPSSRAPKFSLIDAEGYHDETKLPVLRLVPLANPDGTGIQSPDYSRFALEITGKDETSTSVYAPESAIYDNTEYRSSPYQAGSAAPPVQNLVQGQAVGTAQANKLETVHKNKPEAAENNSSVEKADASAVEQPSVEKPSTEQPPAEQPPAEQPAVVEAVQRPAAAESVQQPAASEPVQQPAASEPVQQPAPVESASTESAPETVQDSAPEAEVTAEETPEQ